MDTYLLHCLNHVSKTADRIKRNNTRLEAASKQEQGAEGQAGSVGVDELPRDQVGLSVLFLYWAVVSKQVSREQRGRQGVLVDELPRDQVGRV